MSNWSGLTPAALLGTRRAAPPAPIPAPGLEPLLAALNGLDGRDPAARLLATAGALDLYEQIGRAAARGPLPVVPPAPAADLPACPPRAAGYLALLLEAPRRNLLPEFLAALAANGQAVPPALLPNILGAGVKKGALRPLILPALGAQGRWLAARNPAWAYAAAASAGWPELRRLWTAAAPAERSALVEQLRALDPARGRALFENVWRAENDHTRLRLLKLLETGLGMDDEPLLEMALDDRSHLVRRQAAALLAALPGSRLGGRMGGYVPAYLAWTPGGAQAITISLPQVSAAMRRDGIVGTVSKDAARVRGQEIIQLVSAVPLGWWAANWAAPREVARALSRTLWPRTLSTGFAAAALAQRDATWAGVLLDELGQTALTNRLIAIVDETTLRVLTEKALHENESEDLLDNRGALLALLRRWPGPWPPDLAEAITAVFAARFAATAEARSPVPTLRATLLALALKFPPETAVYAAEAFAPVLGGGAWRATAAEFLHTLQFRGRMLAALEAPAGETA